jgi:hypothetical protein
MAKGERRKEKEKDFGRGDAIPLWGTSGKRNKTQYPYGAQAGKETSRGGLP